jgi:lipopolysaccharide/colanic/teichoic acid biosynthesis glycosyltransferase
MSKRAIDVACAGVLLIVLLPLLALLALAIIVDCPGPVFFKVRRVGRFGDEFGMLKFRKMRPDAGGLPLTTHEDARLTRVGRILTRTRLDELPQLWDVLRGRMSLIGPRPEDPRFVRMHVDTYRGILEVRPGLSGLSQLAYAAEQHILKPEDPVGDYVERVMPQKLTLDTLYAREWTLGMDARILFWTVATVLLGRPVAVNRTTGAMNIRRRRSREIMLERVPAAEPRFVLVTNPSLGGQLSAASALSEEGRGRAA